MYNCPVIICNVIQPVSVIQGQLDVSTSLHFIAKCIGRSKTELWIQAQWSNTAVLLHGVCLRAVRCLAFASSVGVRALPVDLGVMAVSTLSGQRVRGSWGLGCGCGGCCMPAQLSGLADYITYFTIVKSEFCVAHRQHPLNSCGGGIHRGLVMCKYSLQGSSVLRWASAEAVWLWGVEERALQAQGLLCAWCLGRQ